MLRTCLIAGGLLGVTVLPAPAAPDPCSLVSRSEATAVFGARALPATRSASADGTVCRYTDASRTASIVVTVSEKPQALRSMETRARGHAKPIRGLGATAYDLGGTLYLNRGATVVTISLVKGLRAGATSEIQLFALGKNASGRL